MAEPWIKKDREWLRRGTGARQFRAENFHDPEPLQNPVDNPEDPKPYGVIYIPIRCPMRECKSKRIKTYATKKQDGSIIRYHICKDCGKRFRSREYDGPGI